MIFLYLLMSLFIPVKSFHIALFSFVITSVIPCIMDFVVKFFFLILFKTKKWFLVTNDLVFSYLEFLSSVRLLLALNIFSFFYIVCRPPIWISVQYKIIPIYIKIMVLYFNLTFLLYKNFHKKFALAYFVLEWVDFVDFGYGWCCEISLLKFLRVYNKI